MNRLALLAILTAFTLLTVYQSATLPLGEAPDETDHYQYLQFVAQHGHPPLTDSQRVAAGYKGGLAPLYYTIAAWPIALVGVESPPTVRRLDQRAERHIPTDGLGFNRVLHTLDESWAWSGQVLAWHGVRLLSLPLAWVTLLAIYATVRHIFPTEPPLALVAVLLVAFLPRFVISSAVINDDNLVFALCALILLVEVRILRGLTTGAEKPSLATAARRQDWQASRFRQAQPKLTNGVGAASGWFALLGGLFGLALLSKYFALILVPEILLLLWLTARRVPRANLLRLTSCFLLTLTLTAGPWFAFIIYRFNRITELGWLAGLAASLGEPQITNGLVNLLTGQTTPSTAATYPFGEWVGLLTRSFWFEYGWMNLFAPMGVYVALLGWLLVVLYGWFRQAQPTATRAIGGVSLLLMTRCGLFIMVVLMRYTLSATLDTGQGRHLFPALTAISIGVAWCVLRGGWSQLLLAGYVGLSLYTLHPSHVQPHYPTLPVTSQPLDVPDSQPLEFAAGLLLRAAEISPTIEGDGLPVTLYWQAEQEAERDYWLSLCVEGAGCWQGYPTAGRYPPRAWEVGDTVIDKIAIPVSFCEPLTESLRLRIWSLALDSVAPRPLEPPLVDTRLSPPMMFRPTADTCQTETPTEITPSAAWLDSPRQRQFAPLTDSLTFGEKLSPLTVQVGAVRLENIDSIDSNEETPRLQWPVQQPLPVTIGWQARQWLADPIAIALKLLDHEFTLAAEQVTGLGGRYPNVLWQPGEIVTETYRLQPISEAGAGLYRLEMSLLRQNDTLSDGFAYLPLPAAQGHNLYPLTVRLLDAAHGQPPSTELRAHLGEVIALVGYDVRQAAGAVQLALYWQNQAEIGADYTVFTQLLGPDGQVWAQWDNPPQGGRYPTSAWAVNDRVVDRYTLRLRAGAPSGGYRLLVGMYAPSSGVRLPLTVAGQRQPNDALLLTTLDLE